MVIAAIPQGIRICIAALGGDVFHLRFGTKRGAQTDTKATIDFGRLS